MVCLCTSYSPVMLSIYKQPKAEQNVMCMIKHSAILKCGKQPKVLRLGGLKQELISKFSETVDVIQVHLIPLRFDDCIYSLYCVWSLQFVMSSSAKRLY